MATLGYDVDAIEWNDETFIPSQRYDVVLDVFTNLRRLAPLLGPDAVKILYCTGGDPDFQNRAERSRVDAVNARRGASCVPRRIVARVRENYESMECADDIVLLGNEKTRGTYPARFHEKITLLPATSSDLGSWRVEKKGPNPSARDFLWFFGSGAIHKGLDLLLEVFSKRPNLVLHVVGHVKAERDFWTAYRRELTGMTNIRYHGFINAGDPKFHRVLERCFCFVAPSCSEGMSPAVTTCLSAGLFPIISRETGVSLPSGSGIFLDTCSIEEIDAAVQTVWGMSDMELMGQRENTQSSALREYSRDNYTSRIREFLSGRLKKDATDGRLPNLDNVPSKPL